ncbi:NLR, CARD domain-containing protein 3 [Phytophthora pseudosyringae]|uniref:NLR, CARD domain-containing protein 3 n=1 Tax=Phytophthora pseudosyringae TaxID=221518 RepID=A0A8T1VC05_9STRA|nr:NLR, CARD domain-containing protein 3 [Phytophthora pseudosyringae]
MPGKDTPPTETSSSSTPASPEKERDTWDISRINRHWEIDAELRRSLPALARAKRPDQESAGNKFLRLSKLPLPASTAPDPLLTDLATPIRGGRNVSQRSITVTAETKAKYFGQAAKSESYAIFRQLAAQKYLSVEPLSEFLAQQEKNRQQHNSRDEDSNPVPFLPTESVSRGLDNSGGPSSRPHLGAVPRSTSSRPGQRHGVGSVLSGDPFTARHKFSSLCLERDLPPCIRLIVRQYFSPEINVSHMAIGDDLACVFAACLLDLPMVTGLNARNNRLRDRGLQALVDVVVAKPDLYHLDLSENKVDSHAAHALASYLGSASCKLQTLRLASADVDDNELVPFARALHSNKSLQTLDVSRNSVGSSEHLNVVRPSVTTGGEALATMISINSTLMSLDLSWNYLRLAGAVEIGRALAYNSGLRELNLAYNAFGNAGAQAVGDALLSNTTLQRLNMSHNNIPAQGALAIASALKINHALPLTELALGGNPLGCMGGRALLHAAAACADSKKLSVSLEGCNFDASGDGDGSFDPAEPTGSYDLNMEIPYERAVALELLRVANTKQGCKFLSIAHTSALNKQRRNIRVELCETQEGIDARRRLLKTAGILTDVEAPSAREMVSKRLDRESLEALFHELDKDDSGFIDEHELRAGMRKLGLQFHDEDVPRYVALYDLDGTGTIELEEFVELMESFNLNEIDGCFARECVDIETNQLFEIPTEGRLQIDFVDLHVSSGNDSAQSDASVERLIENISSSKNKTQMLFMAKTGLIFKAHEAQLLLEAVRDVCDPSQAVIALLPHMVDPRNAYTLMEHNLSASERLRVQHLMGQALQPMLGLISGHYRIDLSNDLDRVTLRKLIENSNRTAFLRKKGGLKDTSQHVNYHGFRNEILHGKPFVLEAKFLDSAPRFGYLELDYVQLGRAPCHALSNKRFEQMLQLCQLDRMGAGMGVATGVPASSKIVKKARNSISTPAPSSQASTSGDPGFPPQRSFTRKVFEEYEKMNTLRNYIDFGAGLNRAVELSPLPGEQSNSPKTDTSEDESISDGTSRLGPSSPVDSEDKALLVPDSGADGTEERGGVDVDGDALQRVSTPAIPTAPIVCTARRLVFNIQWCLSTRWITVRQAIQLLSVWPVAFAASRCDLVCTIFDRVTDLHNFSGVLSALTDDEAAQALYRLGMLNVLTLLSPDNYYELALARYEERELAKALVRLAIDEPGENWQNETFGWSRDDKVPGWELNYSWLKDGGFPEKGHLSLEYYSGADKGCGPVWPTRRELAAHTLCGLPENLSAFEMQIDSLSMRNVVQRQQQ